MMRYALIFGVTFLNLNGQNHENILQLMHDFLFIALILGLLESHGGVKYYNGKYFGKKRN